MEMPVLVRSLNSSILSSASFQLDDAIRGVGTAAVKHSRPNANIVVSGDGKFGSGG